MPTVSLDNLKIITEFRIQRASPFLTGMEPFHSLFTPMEHRHPPFSLPLSPLPLSLSLCIYLLSLSTLFPLISLSLCLYLLSISIYLFCLDNDCHTHILCYLISARPPTQCQGQGSLGERIIFFAYDLVFCNW